MAFSKIILNGTTLIDLTSDTVATDNLIAPNTAHNNAGVGIVGTVSGGIDGDDLAYGVTSDSIVGTAIVGISVVGAESGSYADSAQVGIALAG